MILTKLEIVSTEEATNPRLSVGMPMFLETTMPFYSVYSACRVIRE